MEQGELKYKDGYQYHESSYIDEPVAIGNGTRIWHFCHILKGAVIGSNCNIGQNVMVGSAARIGSGVKIQNNVSVYDGVVCDDDVFIGPSVVFTNVVNPRSFIERKHEYRPTHIKRGATLGANVTVVCGSTVGEYALVGAGAVVVGDIRPYALVVGNPAGQIGWVSSSGVKLHFDASGMAVCPQTGEKYLLQDGNVNRIE